MAAKEKTKATRKERQLAVRIVIEGARSPQDLFGELTGAADQQYAQARSKYVAFAKLTHPDSVSGDGEVFAKLSLLWEQAERLIRSGSYNEGGLTGLTVRTRKGATYTIGSKIASGSISDVHRLPIGWIKIARHPRDNDLLKNEVRLLRRIRESTADEHLIYLPEPVDSFAIRDSRNHQRQATVFAPLHAGIPADADKWVTLKHVHSVIPAVHPKDAAWMWRRLLTAISLAHDAGVVHHAVVPDNVLILPPEHGVVLIDWCYAREFGQPPLAIDPKYRYWYPTEVTPRKEPSRTETDVHLAGMTMWDLLGGNLATGWFPDSVPAAIRAHLRACTLQNVNTRPSDVLGVLNSFNEIIERLWGKRTFRMFELPT